MHLMSSINLITNVEYASRIHALLLFVKYESRKLPIKGEEECSFYQTQLKNFDATNVTQEIKSTAAGGKFSY